MSASSERRRLSQCTAAPSAAQRREAQRDGRYHATQRTVCNQQQNIRRSRIITVLAISSHQPGTKPRSARTSFASPSNIPCTINPREPPPQTVSLATHVPVLCEYRPMINKPSRYAAPLLLPSTTAALRQAAPPPTHQVDHCSNATSYPIAFQAAKSHPRTTT